jgi:glycosyltransferase involved in cell wall biosynthesis
MVGSVEPQNPVPLSVIAQLKKDARVRFTGIVQDMPLLYASIDILVLPTYREGFPNTLLEAAAMELPVVATWVDGCKEAVENGITGLLVPPRECQALTVAIQELLLDPTKRKQMGIAGRKRVLEDFRPEAIWEFLYRQYQELLQHGKVK